MLSLKSIVTLLSAGKAAAQALCMTNTLTNENDNTVTFEFDQDDLSHVKTTTVGVLGTCHDMGFGASSYRMNVGQNLFNRNIRLIGYTDAGCLGVISTYGLTNKGGCKELSELTFSFKLAYD